MDFIKEKLGSIGLALVAMGIMSGILSIFNYNLKLLMWIDLWGITMGWIIRVLLVVVGAILFFMLGTSNENEENEIENNN